MRLVISLLIILVCSAQSFYWFSRLSGVGISGLRKWNGRKNSLNLGILLLFTYFFPVNQANHAIFYLPVKTLLSSFFLVAWSDVNSPGTRTLAVLFTTVSLGPAQGLVHGRLSQCCWMNVRMSTWMSELMNHFSWGFRFVGPFSPETMSPSSRMNPGSYTCLIVLLYDEWMGRWMSPIAFNTWR